VAKACLLRFGAHVLEAPGARHPLHPAMGRAMETLEREAVELRTASDLSERCGISVSRLRQLFSEAGKESPSAMLWRIKTEHAVRMIRSTGLTLGEIAEQSGFSNPFHLSRCVKMLTGHPPRELRRIEWEGER
jgi:AraC-like DNA-binding protein